jgi:hypothetical protein
MHSHTTIWKLTVISGIVIAYEYFMAKADFIHMLYPNVYNYFVSAQRYFKI